VLALYTPDAVFLDASGSSVAGQPALRKFFASVLGQYSAMPSLHSVESSASGDLGYDWGDYSEVITPLANPAGAIQTHGTYLVILKRVSGHWVIATQMWTGSVPVPVKK
jgi:ketosteroid isomerase-like protein